MIETLTAPPLSQPVPVEPTTPIKPSEALRLGRLTLPFHSPGMYQGLGAACAIGAMAVGWGISVAAVEDRLYDLTDDGNYDAEVIDIFDAAEHRGMDGDAAVLAYLSERGL